MYSKDTEYVHVVLMVCFICILSDCVDEQTEWLWTIQGLL